MSQFKQISAFVGAALRGSLSAAAKAEGVTPAIIGRHIDALERRLGVRLLVRTTRRISLTFEGHAFLEDCQRLLNDLANAEAAVSLGGIKATGHLRLSAPAGFGRLHVAPLVQRFLDANPEVTATLDLSDRVVDLVNEGFDCAVRIGELADSSLVSVKLGDMPRAVVASPEYLKRHGMPRTPADLARHDCLSLGQQRGWIFRMDGETLSIKVSGRLGKVMIPSTLSAIAASNASSSPSPRLGVVRNSTSTFSRRMPAASSRMPARTSSQNEVVPLRVFTEIRSVFLEDKYRAARLGR